MDNFKVYFWITKKLEKASEVLIYALIYSYYERNEECQLSYVQLAEMIGMSKSSAIRAVVNLESKKMIKITRAENDGYCERNIYTIVKEEICEVSNNWEYNECYLCGRNGIGDRLERHHIFGGDRRQLSEKYGLVVYLCGERCHRLGRLSVHQNAEVMDYVHRYGQRKAMQEQGWSVDQFREIFGANYLDDD